MDINQIKGAYCQSCAMPMESDDHYGSNADNTQNRAYCCFCYREGQFIEPEVTLEQMQERVKAIMTEVQVSPAVIEKVINLIPTLKRWRTPPEK